MTTRQALDEPELLVDPFHALGKVPVELPPGEWMVAMRMPYTPDGKLAGWLTENNSKTESRVGGILRSKRVKAWRIGARDTLSIGRVPQGLRKIWVQFTVHATERRGRDKGNFEPTFKPIIDAMTPQRHERKPGKPGEPAKIVVHIGHGVIANDTPEHIERAPERFGEPLGRNHPVGGVVIIHIRDLSPQESS